MKSIAILCASLMSFLAYSATYYIDFDSGDDTNAGTSTSEPWKTIPGTRDVGDTAFITSNYGSGTLVSGSVKVPEPTTFWIKSGTSHTSSDGGRILMDSSFYSTTGATNYVTIKVDTAWGSGPVLIDGTGMTIAAYRGLLEMRRVIGVTVDGISSDNLLLANSGRDGILAFGHGDCSFSLNNLTVSNSIAANIKIYSDDAATPAYLQNVGIRGVKALVTHNDDDTAANIYLGFVDGGVIEDSEGNGALAGADGIHLDSCRNIWIENCITHDNQEQGVDISRSGDYKTRDDGYNITVRNCVSYDNKKMNYAQNSGVHGVYFVNCIGWRNTITATGDGGFELYEGTAGTNYWINCTSARSYDSGYLIQWNSNPWSIPAGTYPVYLINCLTENDGLKSLLVGVDAGSCSFHVDLHTCVFGSDAVGYFGKVWNTNYSTLSDFTNSPALTVTNLQLTDVLFANDQALYTSCDPRLQYGSHGSSSGVFPFTLASGVAVAKTLDLTPLVQGLDARRLFRAGDTLRIGTWGSGVIESVDDENTITLTENISLDAGTGVWLKQPSPGISIGAAGTMWSLGGSLNVDTLTVGNIR